jgi:lipopolysaccharide export system permease protein
VKILDAYILKSFLKNWAISFMVLVGMYMVLDMVFKFDEVVAIKPPEVATSTTRPSDVAPATTKPSEPETSDTILQVFYNAADFYFFQSFLFFNHLSGIIPVVAAAFTLMRLSRFNELTAVMAAGVPLLRVAMPIILAGVVLNALVIVNQELIIPNISDKLSREVDEIPGSKAEQFPIRAMQDDHGDLLFTSRYTPPRDNVPAEMLYVAILEHNDKDQVTGMITAPRAIFDPGDQKWLLEGGQRVTGLLANESPQGPFDVTEWKTNIDPEEVKLFKKSDYVDLLSTDRINQLLDRPESYGKANLLRVKHWRFTQPLMNVILLLLAIPCVLTREPGNLKSAATKCLILTGIGMAAIFLSQQLAANAPDIRFAAQWPALMAWLPIFLFAPLAVFLLDRVKT